MSNDASLANFGWKLWPQIKVYLARLVYSIYSRTIFTNGSGVYYNILIEDFIGIYFYIQQNVYALCVE